MAVLLLQWCYISILAFVWGYTALSLLSDTNSDTEQSSSFPAVFIFLLGLAVIAFLANLSSLFVPIRLELQLFLILIPLGILSWKGSHLAILLKYFSKINFWLILPLAFISANLCLGTTSNIDEGGYYLPLVKWIEVYQAVPGSALFIARTGFNSSCHMLSAVFGFESLFPGGIYEINGCLFIWFNYYFISVALKGIFRTELPDLIHYVSAAALVFPFSYLLDSIDADYLSIMGGLVLLSLVSRDLLSKTKPGTKLIYYWIVGLFLMTVKTLSGFLMLVPLLYIPFKKTKLKLLLPLTGLTIIYLLPWFGRNVITTGYLIFPLHYVDLFDFDWKVPVEMTQASHLIVEEFAKIEKIRTSYTLDGVQSLAFRSWFPIWVSNAKAQIIGWASFLALSITGIAWLIVCVKELSEKRYKWPAICTLCIAVLSFWFLKFPAIRFGWSWILFSSVLSIFYFIREYFSKLGKPFLLLLLILAIASWTRLLYQQSVHMNLNRTKLVYPEKRKTNLGFRVDSTTGFAIQISDGEACHGVAPPCKPYNNNYQIEARGKEIEAGFRIKN